jgi:hypothetical protein
MGAYLFAEPVGMVLDHNSFDRLIHDLQKTYFRAYDLSRRAF